MEDHQTISVPRASYAPMFPIAQRRPHAGAHSDLGGWITKSHDANNHRAPTRPWRPQGRDGARASMGHDKCTRVRRRWAAERRDLWPTMFFEPPVT